MGCSTLSRNSNYFLYKHILNFWLEKFVFLCQKMKLVHIRTAHLNWFCKKNKPSFITIHDSVSLSGPTTISWAGEVTWPISEPFWLLPCRSDKLRNRQRQLIKAWKSFIRVSRKFQFHRLVITFHSRPENLKKFRQKNSWNQINQKKFFVKLHF